MVEQNLIFSIFLIFTGAAIFSTIALFTRQSTLVAYMLLGVVLGPWGLKWLGDLEVIRHVGNVGIIFLLFLLGLHLPPQKLLHMLKQVSVVGLISSLIFAGIGYLVGYCFGFSEMECLVIGAAMMFSSTIIGIKLLPTTVLHHQHTGEIIISVLLLQDLIAIAVLLVMHASTSSGFVWSQMLMVGVSFPGILLFAYLVERLVLVRLLSRFNRIKEYMFLVAIAWCLSMAQLATYVGLSDEVGAFIAGFMLAASPVSIYLAESMKPIRDFFLVLFFFSVGASFDLTYWKIVLYPALTLVGTLTIIKPVVYRYLFHKLHESREMAWEVGIRLGQISEFSLIVAYVGLANGLIGDTAGYLIQAATMLSFIFSSYWVVLRYPTPVAVSDRLRRD